MHHHLLHQHSMHQHSMHQALGKTRTGSSKNSEYHSDGGAVMVKKNFKVGSYILDHLLVEHISYSATRLG
jgi:hypothetical protein